MIDTIIVIEAIALGLIAVGIVLLIVTFVMSLKSRTAKRSVRSTTQELMEVIEPKVLQIVIKQDGSVVWINSEDRCLLRACRIQSLEVRDERDD